MKFTLSLMLLAITSIFVSCNNAGSHSSEEMAIELNNGQKWEVNSEMSPFILAGEKILQEYNGSDYKNLADQLKDENKKLIKSCTMKGKAHDELHKWLHPHMQLIESLGDAENNDEANILVENLNKSFVTYHTYFQ